MLLPGAQQCLPAQLPLELFMMLNLHAWHSQAHAAVDGTMQQLVSCTLFGEAAEQALHADYTVDAAVLTAGIADSELVLNVVPRCHDAEMGAEEDLRAETATPT